MEGLIEFDVSLPATEESWGFAADFVADATEFATAPKRPADDLQDAAELSWLFQRALEGANLGMVECSGDWVDVSARVSELMRNLADSHDDSALRSETLTEIAELRTACRRTGSWRRFDYDWPLLSD